MLFVLVNIQPYNHLSHQSSSNREILIFIIIGGEGRGSSSREVTTTWTTLTHLSQGAAQTTPRCLFHSLPRSSLSRIPALAKFRLKPKYHECQHKLDLMSFHIRYLKAPRKQEERDNPKYHWAKPRL